MPPEPPEAELFRTVWRFLRMLGCDPSEAEDLAQEAMLRLLRNRRIRVDAPEAQPWLLAVTRNLLIDVRRRQSRALSVPWTQEVEERLNHEAELHGAESVWTEAARECVDALPGRTAAVVVGFYRDNLSRRELADRLGMTEAGVKTALQRARERIKQCIERKLPAGTSIEPTPLQPTPKPC